MLDAIDRAEAATAHNDRMTLFVVLNYGGRQEVLDAAER
ncbi:Undecaprenyl pyrophosphate synthetase [Mycobacterium marinum str. Europe]|nr:Undecaprenyl pyrophosphate synthetase [Mycobacterium marinum str. Europe]